jgi:lipid-A-disaccharide synthase
MEHIGLANIVAGESVAPEFIQADANPEALAGMANSLLADEAKRVEMVESFAAVRELLRPMSSGASARVAEIVSEYL